MSRLSKDLAVSIVASVLFVILFATVDLAEILCELTRNYNDFIVDGM